MLDKLTKRLYNMNIRLVNDFYNFISNKVGVPETYYK